jgi:hypothetical protein
MPGRRVHTDHARARGSPVSLDRQRSDDLLEELEELEELDEPPPPLEELEELDELEDELLELLLDEPAPAELVEDEEDAVASVGLLPAQAVSSPTPARAAPPDSRIKKSRLSVSADASSRVRSSLGKSPPRSCGAQAIVANRGNHPNEAFDPYAPASRRAARRRRRAQSSPGAGELGFSAGR